MKPDTRSFYELAVLRAMNQVVRGLDQALHLDALAGEVGMSAFHFHRVFRGMVGETPLAMHRRLRLERAAWALRHSDASVTRIAFDAGYDTHEAFTRAFGAAYGAPPSSFRAMTRPESEDCIRAAQVELASRSGIHWAPGEWPAVAIPFHAEYPHMEVNIVDRPAMRAAAVRHVGPYSGISEAFARLHALAAPAGLLNAGAQMIAVYHDDPEAVPEAALRSDAALTVQDDTRVPAGLETLELPGGRYACAIHIGPYEQLGDAWARLMGGWLPQSGHRIGEGTPYELYRNNPTNSPPERLRTELYVPIA